MLASLITRAALAAVSVAVCYAIASPLLARGIDALNSIAAVLNGVRP